MNEHTFIGNLTRDPQLHSSSSTGRAVGTFDIAVNHRRLDRRTGEFVDQAPVFHRLVSYGPVAQTWRRACAAASGSSWSAGSSTTATSRTASCSAG
jgi:single-stranded DNA-binding protein